MPAETENRATIAIIGAGPLGRWLALAAARASFRVLLEDVMPSNLHHAQEYIRQQLSPRPLADASHGEVTVLTATRDLKDVPAFHRDIEFPEDADLGPSGLPASLTGDIQAAEDSDSAEWENSAGLAASVANEGPCISAVTCVSSIEDAVRDADLAIDCVPDELESKLEILWLLDRMAPPRTVVATPTTRLSIVDLAACTYRADKCVAIVADARDLVERPASEILLRTTPRTSSETIALVESFWRGLGFAPVIEMEQAPVR